MNTASIDRQIELERKDAERNALERAATKLENFATNEVYKRAFRIAAKMVRDMSKE
jgi:hypothetical protein